jgi:hypothetical protein
VNAPAPPTLEACSLRELAENMRDRKWVDMRVDGIGVLQRVRIIEIRVKAEGEDIVVRQEFLDLDDFVVCTHVVDADAIWRVLPTNYHTEQVEPYGRRRPRTELPSAPRARWPTPLWPGERAMVVAAVKYEVARETGCSLSTALELSTIDAKHRAVLLTYELTDLAAYEVCACFGYHSTSPLGLPARAKLNNATWRASIDKMERNIRKHRTLRTYRRPDFSSYLRRPREAAQ